MPKQINLAKLLREENWALPADTVKTLLPSYPCWEKQSFIKCVSEKLGVKECLPRVTSSVSPVNCGWSWKSYCLVNKAYDMTTGFIA